MKLKGSMLRIHREERERIYYLKAILDQQEALASYGEQYQKLGWDLVALKAQDGTSRENVPLESSLNHDRYDRIESSGGRSREPQAQLGGRVRSRGV